MMTPNCYDAPLRRQCGAAIPGSWREGVMRRSLLLVILTLAVVGLVGAIRLPGAIAQNGTPTAGGTPGPSGEALAVGHVQTLPPAPADLALFRFTLQPGEAFAI